MGGTKSEVGVNRIMTRVLLAFWTVWFGFRALAAFDFGGIVMSDQSPSSLPLTFPGLWDGVALAIVAGLFVWAFMASLLADPAEEADAHMVMKVAFSAAAAWLGGFCLLQLDGGGDPLAPDGTAVMALLLVSFAVAMREAAWTPRPATSTTVVIPERRMQLAGAAPAHPANVIRFSRPETTSGEGSR